MSKFEPQALVQNCWNCRHSDKSVIYTSYPAKIRCKMFDTLVFEDNTVCLADKPQAEERDELGEKAWNTELIRKALAVFVEKKEPSWGKYRKRPVVIEAYQTDKEMEISTLEGTMKANVGDWIIKGVNGELYPCKPDIFAKTYEEIKQ